MRCLGTWRFSREGGDYEEALNSVFGWSVSGSGSFFKSRRLTGDGRVDILVTE